ncbi:MAG TPA: phosphoribosylglycinamide formyltransferase [Bacteroidales bacterium]|nr:phosphoribosylglycinamide formyltransferase [Bacteroidales bacterium]HNZ43287.1 phosphoribosylglycinamide formyltransferase [Bacteroidales bacterium]HPB25155.1 phosphoribosylglycinamide formyltransferase [Bacteroidales bacterium]HPI31100.1 phosphoribosylglycinamide formyltransferase [Bacteroidales bacterium]HQN15705.1 phosphoribosylglycinamide formyltransferase [Bacteroidales bacterium]
MKKIAIFASGNGSNAENIINHFAGSQSVEIALILCNNSKAYVIERAKNHRIPCMIFKSKELRETPVVLNKLKELNIDFIVLAGFLLLIPTAIIRAFHNRIINIHPALLPKYGGKGMYGGFVHEAVRNSGDTETGISIHFVNEKYDAGAVIFQARCPVTPEDTAETIAHKVHQLEYRYFPEIIEKVIAGKAGRPSASSVL